MTPERYERLCRLFDQAQELAPAERAAFLQRACAEDSSLRADLEKFLADDRKARAEQLLQGLCPVNARALIAADRPGFVGPCGRPRQGAYARAWGAIGRRSGPALPGGGSRLQGPPRRRSARRNGGG
jgi:hypothetical protein